jgi:hypothetical protein
MQLVASISLIVIGLILGLVADVAADMRIFGYVLAGVGALGLLIRAAIARPGRRGPHGRSRQQ